MEEKNPLDPIIEQLEDLLAQCSKEFSRTTHTKKKPEGLLDQVASLEAQMQIFKEVADNVLKEVGEKKNVTSQEAARLNILQDDITKKRTNVLCSLQVIEKGERLKKQKGRGRKKKFRGLNPRGKWQKL